MFLFGVHIHDVYNKLTPELEDADADPRNYLNSMKGTSASALKREHRRQKAEAQSLDHVPSPQGEPSPRPGVPSPRPGQTIRFADDASQLNTPLLGADSQQDKSFALSEEKSEKSMESTLSQRFKKRATFFSQQSGIRSEQLRPWYLLQLQRAGLLTLEKSAPNDHDRLFFFHEASPDIYKHFLGDLLFF